MKKIISIFMAVCIFALVLTCGAFAVSLENGKKYEVPITLIHAEKDKTSMGDKYIFNTALIENQNGKKYLTMVTDSDISNLNFWYYNDGSVEGDTTEAETVSNVEIGGTTYDVGYRFPLCGDEQLVGVKFSASIMPMKPSARVKIDYDSAKEVTYTSVSESTEPSTEAAAQQATQTTTAAPATTAATTENTTVSTTAAPVTSTQPTSAPTQVTATAIDNQPATAVANNAVVEQTATVEISSAYPIAIIALVLAIITLIAILISNAFTEGKKEND
ncbi:MAG: hypothetical protein NC122_10240 [Faecalibacterium sp.]|nr:hypothetical protein [Ruminococcus sp.]MCM1391156.1 hypothetical protein [Ruminococcus sp.]MCM1486570.1 hypothetical protein [Faecalibacterium sp.]